MSMYKIQQEDPSLDFKKAWSAAGKILSSLGDGRLNWLRATLTPPFVEHFSFRIGNQIIFVFIEAKEQRFSDWREPFLKVSEEANAIPCIMRMEIKGAEYFPVLPDWGMVHAESMKQINPLDYVNDDLIEMSNWELHDMAIQSIRSYIEKKGGIVLSYQSSLHVDPSIWFEKYGKRYWVLVRAARYPKIEAEKPENWNEIMLDCNSKSDGGWFSSVGIVNADDPFDPDAVKNGNFLPIYRGQKLSIKMKGILGEPDYPPVSLETKILGNKKPRVFVQRGSAWDSYKGSKKWSEITIKEQNQFFAEQFTDAGDTQWNQAMQSDLLKTHALALRTLIVYIFLSLKDSGFIETNELTDDNYAYTISESLDEIVIGKRIRDYALDIDSDVTELFEEDFTFLNQLDEMDAPFDYYYDFKEFLLKNLRRCSSFADSPQSYLDHGAVIAEKEKKNFSNPSTSKQSSTIPRELKKALDERTSSSFKHQIKMDKLKSSSSRKGVYINIFKTSEGKRRLRILVSFLIAVGTYIYLLNDEYRVDGGELFFKFPIISIIVSSVAFLLLTAFYWVLEGFSKNKHNYDQTRLNSNILSVKELFQAADEASTEFHSRLISMADFEKKGNPKFDEINEQIIESWKRPALVYAFGLTCICALKINKDFIKTNQAMVFTQKVADRLLTLSHNELFKKYKIQIEPSKAKKEAFKDLEFALNSALYFYKKRKNNIDLLQPLIEYVSDNTGLKEPSHLSNMSAFGKTLLRKIENNIG